MKRILSVIFIAALISCGNNSEKTDDDQQNVNQNSEGTVPTTYSNPVCHLGLPDPTIIKVDDTFYLYATEDIRNVPIMSSRNLVTWKQCGTVFTDMTRPTFVADGGVWAPDVNKVGNLYVLYYSMSVWGGEWTCGIGTAVSEKPEGPWTDRGPLFVSKEIGVQNSIDPFYIEEDGKKYLFWGSFHGIWAIELSDNGLSVKQGAEKRQVAGSAYEGVYVHKRDGYYYLFASTGTCCEGYDSKYSTVVGRSKNLLGPYCDRSGRDMMQNNHEVILKGDGKAFFGPGHNSEIVTDSKGNDWILYHAFTKVTGDRYRTLMLDKVEWKNGWPQINAGHPSAVAERPSF